MATVESWAAIFKNPEYLGETFTVNYFKNKEQIEADIASEKSDLANKNYVQAGNDFADISVDLIGTPPSGFVSGVY